MGRDNRPDFPACDLGNFNSHARVGRDNFSLALAKMIKISTHTPAWGATCCCISIDLKNSISTHTPAWGATGYSWESVAYHSHFNSHARVGRDDTLG